MTKEFLHTFEGGMNQDLHRSVVQKNTSIEVKNFRPVVSNTGTLGTLETVEGNYFAYSTVYVSPQSGLADGTYRVVYGDVIFNGFTYSQGDEFIVASSSTPTNTTGTGTFIPSSYMVDKTSYYICGVISIRDYLYIFSTTNTSSTPSGGVSIISEARVNSSGQITSSTTIYDDSDNGSGSDYLNFSTANPIKGIGRIETGDIRKIYWTDGYNKLRYAIVSNNLTTNGEAYIQTINPYFPTDKFELLPDSALSVAKLNNIVSGNIPNGVVKYTYQLYNRNGSETAFAPVTGFINATPSDDFSNNSATYVGGLPDESSGKGFNLKIDATGNDGFNRARVIAIHYSNLNDLPTIRIAGEVEINTTGGVFYFTDTGENIGEYTVEEFAIIGTKNITVKDIVEKDDRLLAANITEDYFDISGYDTRSYRFDSSGIAKIYEADGSGYAIYRAGVTKLGSGSAASADGDWEYFTADPFGSGTLSTSGTNWSIPETADCINKFNDFSNDTDSTYQQLYDIDNTLVGSSGKNIDLKIDFKAITIDSYSSTDAKYIYETTDGTLLGSYTGFTNPYVSLNYKHLQPGEVYRIGIQFFDDKGRPSFVSWVNDFRINRYGTYKTFSRYLASPSSADVDTAALYLSVNVKTQPTNAVGFRLMFVPRSTKDRSIRATGILQRVASGKPSVGNDTILNTDTLVRFISPEISFNKNISLTANDRLVYGGYMATGSPLTLEYGGTGVGYDTHILKYRSSTVLTWSGAISANYFSDITDMRIVTPSKDQIDVGGVSYSNYNSSTDVNAYGGTCLVIKHANSSWEAVNSKAAPIVYYERNLFGSRYGGNTYEARTNNEYAPLSDKFTTYSSFVSSYGGDTVTSYFDYSSLLWDLTKDLSSSSSNSESLYIPLPSSINPRLRSGRSFSQYFYDGVDFPQLIQEYGGDHTDPSGKIFHQDDDGLYTYNSVYSQYNDVVLYPTTPFDFQQTSAFDTRVIYSEKKINGEEHDSWTSFLSNNYIDVESDKGELINLFVFKNRLLFFQENGLGLLSMNQRSLIQDNNPGKLILGEGGVLDRYDYLSNDVGNQSFESIAASEDGVYWYYPGNKEIYSFDGKGVVPLSKVKGITSWLRRNVSSSDEVKAVYDANNNEVLFSFGVYGVLAYNEFIKAFTSLYTYYVERFFKSYNNSVLVLNKYNNQNTHDLCLFLLNVNDIDKRSTFYEQKYDSSIKFVVNQDYTNSKVFDNISFYTESYSEDIYYPDDHKPLFLETFDKIRVYNDFQNTDWVTLTKGTNLERRKNEWTLAVPRNVVNKNISTESSIFDPANLDSTQKFKERIRGNYCTIDLVSSTSSSNKKLVIPYVKVYYRDSIR